MDGVSRMGLGPGRSGGTKYLKRFGSVTVLNGHIHQVVQKVEGNVSFHHNIFDGIPLQYPARPCVRAYSRSCREVEAVLWNQKVRCVLEHSHSHCGFVTRGDGVMWGRTTAIFLVLTFIAPFVLARVVCFWKCRSLRRITVREEIHHRPSHSLRNAASDATASSRIVIRTVQGVYGRPSGSIADYAYSLR